MRFLGMAGYYRHFCKKFSVIVKPLTNLLHKRKEFLWSKDFQAACQRVIGILTHYPILTAPNFMKEFKLAVDTSDIGAGVVLLQEDDKGIDHPLCYFSKKFTATQKRYCTYHRKRVVSVLSRMRILPIRVWDIPYAYTRMGCLYTYGMTSLQRFYLTITFECCS